MDPTVKIVAVSAGLVVAGAGWKWASQRWEYGDTIIRLVLAAFILSLPIISLFH